MVVTTTKLEAINIMLSAVGESPVSALDGSNADAVVAENILDEVNKDVQSRAWHFNTEYDVVLTPDAETNQITLPTNASRVDLEDVNAGTKDVVERGRKLYDKKAHSYTFTESVKATVAYLFEFVDLPENARRYIAIRAARIFQDRMVGSPDHHTFNLRDELTALSDLKEYEGDTGDHTIFDNYDVFRIVDRGSVISRVTGTAAKP